MNTMLHLVITLVVSLASIGRLAGARWPWRSPRTGILLWQLLMLTIVLCVLGIAFLAVPELGVTAAIALVGVGTRHWLGTLRTRRRHRDVLSLVARVDAAVPGVLVLDHPLTVAYCVPGSRPHVVLSSGALAALTRPELAAVLAHERAHAKERHDLVLLPFLVLRPIFPTAAAAVALLVEMRADECAAPSPLATALRRFTAVVPPGALGIVDAAVLARLQRLAGPREPLPALVRWGVVLAGLTLVTTPLSFLVW
jgi:Zn-dependent protease with chaperone function